MARHLLLVLLLAAFAWQVALGQPALVLLAGVAVPVIGLLLLIALVARDGAAIRQRAIGVGVAVLVGAASLGWFRLDLSIGERRGRAVIDAVERYRAAHGVYPDGLAELVPSQLDEVPRATPLRLSFNAFEYTRAADDPEDPHLRWTELPPFGRVFYSFGEQRWGYLD